MAIFPLSLPLVITPPGIASLIALGVIAQPSDETLLVVLAAFLFVQAVNLVVFMIESRWEDRINPALHQVAGRLIGVLLVAFGISIGIDGLDELGTIAE